jgi:stage II sporulation protein D
VLLLLVTASPASAGTKLVVTGRGWGHGVGMSQWGAYGYASHGWTWQRILAHYYPGTRIGDAPLASVRVLLAAHAHRPAIACTGGIRVSDATGRTYPLPMGSYNVGRKLELPVAHRRVRVSRGLQHRERFTTVPANRALHAPVVFDCPTSPLLLNGRAYHGRLVLRHAGAGLAVVNTVPLDEYVRGVVGGEMPHRWSVAALAAQAVAARSYALAMLKPRKTFDLYSDTRSQVYGGIASEAGRTDAAVEMTAGKVLTWNGHVATTFFFSTSGGRTADVSEVWPSFGHVPYLRSVDDPYDVRSPHHTWGPIVLDGKRVARRLHAALGAVRVDRLPSGRVASVQLGSRRIDGEEFRRKLGLASTWFDVGELSLVPSRVQVSYGGKLALSLGAENVGRARLERKVGAGDWKTLASSVVGRRQVSVEPQGLTLYRLSAGSVMGPVVAVAVTPLLRIEPTGTDQLSGDVRPVVRTEVTVERRVGPNWQVVAHPQVDAQGRFNAPLRLRAGSYRVTVAGDGRFADTSTGLNVTPRLLASLTSQ